MRLSREEIVGRVKDAFERFESLYAELGGHRYYGFADYGDPRNYKGPLIWSEGDCALRFAFALEEQFPRMVHLEMPIARYTVGDYSPGEDRRQFVDIAVSDLGAFTPERDVFVKHRHDLFVEVKYIGRGGERWLFDSRKKLPAIGRDAARLHRHIQRGHCEVGAVLVVDDDNISEGNLRNVTWPEDVLLLLASPSRIRV